MAGNRKSRVVLQQRDIRLLEELSNMKVINREQAELVAGFHSTTRANTRLLSLVRAGLLKRVPTGGREAIYSPANHAASSHEKHPARRAFESGVLFVNHQIAINNVYLTVKYRIAPGAGIRLVRWLTFADTLSKAIPLIPDAYFEIEAASRIIPMFLEVDLGSESVIVWQKKIQLYLQLAVSGEFATLFQQPQFRVLVVTTSLQRLHNIQVAVAKLTTKIFWMTTFQEINHDRFWSPIWHRPIGEQKLSLL